MMRVIMRVVLVVWAVGACAQDEGAAGDGSVGDAASGEEDDDGATEGGAADGDAADAAICSVDGGCMECDPGLGLTEPVSQCTAADPCTRLLPTYTRLGISEITTPSFSTQCRTPTWAVNNGRVLFDDGQPKTWQTSEGVDRHFCEYRPPGGSPASRRPLLIYLHGSGGNARTVYAATSLRAKAESFELSGDPARLGFILAAPGGRHLHWPTSEPQDGSKYDSFHRDLASPSGNPDIAFVDYIVDTLVAEGIVDPRRIFVTGWSNGARFAALYGVARHRSPTPGGNRVAAVATYSGGDPFENTRPGQEPSCKADPYPKTTLPFLVISRSCDAVACNRAQADSWNTEIPPGNVVEQWVETMHTTMGNSTARWLIIGDDALDRTACESPCRWDRAVANHMMWPDGVDDGSGSDREIDLLGFLAAHPLP